MGMKHFNPTTPSLRNMTVSTFDEITKKTPEKSLLATKKKNAGRTHMEELLLDIKVEETDKNIE